jgi:signal peptidase II
MALGAWGRVVLVAAGVVALDQATKALVRATVDEGERIAVVPGVEIVHTKNTGVAFGALSGGGAVVTLVVALALALLLVYFATHVRRPLFWLPTGMLLGELPLGFPAFNVADMSITAGVLVLLYVLERDDAPARRS